MRKNGFLSFFQVYFFFRKKLFRLLFFIIIFWIACESLHFLSAIRGPLCSEHIWRRALFVCSVDGQDQKPPQELQGYYIWMHEKRFLQGISEKVIIRMANFRRNFQESFPTHQKVFIIFPLCVPLKKENWWSVRGKHELLWFYFGALSEWLRELAPRPIGCS